MKQRVRVVGIVRNEDGVLLFKRSVSRGEALPVWELPTGKIEFGEQPEEAMARCLLEYANISAGEVVLKDVITFLAPDGASRLSNLYIIYDIKTEKNLRPEPRLRYNAYKYVKDFETGKSNLRLDAASSAVLEITEGKVLPNRISPRATASSIVVQTDGASRGNPGPSGIGYVIYNYDGQVLEQGGEFIGFTTARRAEYLAMKKGIERALALGFKTARFRSDSMTTVGQINGNLRVKNRDVVDVFDEIGELLNGFDSVTFKHIRREQNQVADGEANAAIDRVLKK